MVEFAELPVWVLVAIPVIVILFLLTLNQSRKKTNRKSHFSAEYFRGLNYLLNDEQDKALDIFVKLVETDWETIDTHFALGKIFRKNGEIDKAIKVHQGLIARPSLPDKYRNRVLLELGYDYLGAGWFDRAEGLFKEVLIHDPKSEMALNNLILIYQQEKDWHKAIDAAEILFSEKPAKVGSMISQYYCELADIARAKGDVSLVENYANQALRYDSSSVRATLLIADMAMEARDYKKARSMLLRIEKQDAEFIPMVIDKLVECHHHMDEPEALMDYMNDLEERQAELPLLESHAKVIELYKGKEDAIGYVMEKLSKAPSLRAMNQLLDYQDTINDTQAHTMMQKLNAAVHVMHQEQPDYQCRQCGFKANTLYWLCPSCQNWSSVKPYTGEQAANE
ncbi:MAG: lipopolysaccharide assembly protein LapB [Gammaproteobacteria bacterium]|nr:lipopolysaccharide assembly protein LapB [Gammaproteobacteria bacterium]